MRFGCRSAPRADIDRFNGHQQLIARKSDLIARPHLEMGFADPLRVYAAGQAQAPFVNDGLSFAARLCETGAVQPNIESAAFFGVIAQFLSPDLLSLKPFSAARAAKGEFSSDLRERGALPAE